MTERRQKRSRKLQVALKLWLSAIGRQHGVSGYVLCDPFGHLVASNLELAEARRWAGLAPACVLSARPLPRPLPGPAVIREVTLDGETLVLCAIGDFPAAGEMNATEAGLKRIFAEAA